MVNMEKCYRNKIIIIVIIINCITLTAYWSHILNSFIY